MIYPRISNCVSENERALTPKDRLNKALNQKLDEVEIRKQRMVTLDKKIAKLPDGSEKRKLMYQKQQTEENNRKHKKSPIDEERNLHESYQILLRVSLWILIIMGVDWVYPKFGFQKCKGENLWFNFLSFLHVIFSNYLLFPHLFLA